MRGEPLAWLLRTMLQAETDDCILWPFGKFADGYASLGKEKVHRVVLAAFAGTPPAPKAMALHSCDVRACINPRHLRWGTALENLRDAQERDRSARGSRHGNALLTEEQVRAIRALRAGGITGVEVALRFGIAETTVCAIVRRRTWKHVA